MSKSYNIPRNICLDKLGHKIPVQVRHSKRAKRLFIRINLNTVELVMPNSNFSKAYSFLLSKEDWIRNKLKLYRKVIDTAGDIPILGRTYKVSHFETSKEKVQLHDDGKLVVFCSLNNKIRTLKQFLIDFLLLEIEPIINNLCNKMNLQVSRIRISDTKSSWGSCSSKKILSFNWRLVFVPPKILFYVIVHEVCHLIEMNHSNRFWQLVSNLCPNYQQDKLWLKNNTLRLQHYDLNLCFR